jgi:hypothetical protein
MRIVLLVTIAAVMTVAMLALAGTAFAAPDPLAGNPSCFGLAARSEQGQPGPGAAVSLFTSNNTGQTVSEAAQNIGPVQHARFCPEPGGGPFPPS